MSLHCKTRLRRLLSSTLIFGLVGGLFLASRPVSAVTIPASCPQNIPGGAELKVSGKPAIYVATVINNQLQIRPFFDSYRYKSFKPDYGPYVRVTEECIRALAQPLQAPFGINHRPGSFLVKREGESQLYAVLPGNALAKISDSIAKTLHGVNYKVRILPNREWADYVCKKPDLTTAKAYPGMTFKLSSDASKVWYVDTQNKLREVQSGALASNFISSEFIYTVPDSAVQGLAKGDTITTGILELTDRTGSNISCAGEVIVPPNSDNQAPTVSLSAPANGATVKDTATIQATASDNVGVTKVEFYVNNNLVGSDATAPYAYDWNTKNTPNGQVTLQARAYDVAGNSSLSPSVSVKVENAVQSNEVGELKLTQVNGLLGVPLKDQTVLVEDSAIVYAFKLEAQKEPIKLTNLKLTARGGKLRTDDISSVKLFRQVGDNGAIEAAPFSDNKLQKSCDGKARFGDGTDAECFFTWTDANNLLPDVINPGTPVYIRVRVDIGKKGDAHIGNYFKFVIANNADISGKGNSSGKEVSVLPTPDFSQTGYTQIIPAKVEIVGLDPEPGKIKTVNGTSWLGTFKVVNYSNKAIKISKLNFVDKGIHEGKSTTYKLFYQPDGALANFLAATTVDDTFNFTNLNGGAGILVDANSFVYLDIGFNSMGGAKPGDVWSLVVPQKPALPSDPTAEYFMSEVVYGYDNDYDTKLNGFIDHLPIVGTPSLGTSALEGAPPRGF